MGVSPNYILHDGYTLFTKAIEEGNHSIVFLFASYCNPTIKDSRNINPITFSIIMK